MEWNASYLYIFAPLFSPPEKIIILNLVSAISRKIFMFWLYMYMYMELNNI